LVAEDRHHDRYDQKRQIRNRVGGEAFDQGDAKEYRQEAEPDDRKDPLVKERHP
jgi:hypothetical protein